MDILTQRLQASLGGAFTIDRELAAGGTSRVFVARENALDRQVVIKTLDLEMPAAGSAERFRREVSTIAKLQHPHIVPLLTAGGDDTLLWYAMPFVAGESLRERLVRDGALPLTDAIRVSRELLDALGFAHEHGIVHGDVKPENILLEGKHAVVADFGIAKAIAAAAGGNRPELAQDHGADLYAAGAVMYEMLVGAPPFSGDARAIVAAHPTAPVPNVSDRRRDVPPRIAALVARLLATHPAERPQNAREVLALLDDVAAAPAPAPKVITERQARVMLIAIVVALVAAAAIVGTWWARRTIAAAPVADGAVVIAALVTEWKASCMMG
jgi:serine/threonine-protein kinase